MTRTPRLKPPIHKVACVVGDDTFEGIQSVQKRLGTNVSYVLRELVDLGLKQDRTLRMARKLEARSRALKRDLAKR